jgi:hypothetical protein
MRKTTENKEFQINVTYTAQQINEIVSWYIETEMPPIYKNYNFEDDEVADMIEDLAIKTLLDVGSNQLMNEFLNELILSFTDEGEGG